MVIHPLFWVPLGSVKLRDTVWGGTTYSNAMMSNSTTTTDKDALATHLQCRWFHGVQIDRAHANEAVVGGCL